MEEKKLGEEKTRFRKLTGPARTFEKIIGVLVPITGIFFIIDVPLLLGYSVFQQQFLGFFLGSLLSLVFLINPPWPNSSRDKLPWYDLLFAILSLAGGLYVLIYYPTLIRTIGVLSVYRVIIGIITLLLIIEGTRRLSGWALVAVVAVFILYFKFGYMLSGPLAAPKISFARMATQLFLGADAIYGVALRTAGLVVFGFILFGQLLFSTGGANFLFGIAESLMGRYRGGTAKAGILASSFFGMLSGSAVANVAATGSLTIPMMKKMGYSSHFAAGVNAVAATGGVICPPIMGAAAFIIAEFLSISYAEVVLIAIVPAVLYYLSLFVQVDLRSAKEGLVGMPHEEIPSFIKLIKEGWFYLIPILVLVYVILIVHMRPESAALYSLAVLIVIGLLKKDIRSKLKAVVPILEATSKGMIEVAVICGAAGIIIGIMSFSGLGLTLSRVLTQLAGNSVLILSFLTAIVSLILGMGMPVTAAYLLLALLVVPAMTLMGVPPIIAHMFVFYFGAFSFITPPVCLAAYAASSIAGADFMKTATAAMKLAIPAFIVPFLFIFNPAVALIGTAGEITREIFFSVIAVISISIAVEGYFKKKLSTVVQLLFGLVAVSLFLPLPPVSSTISTVVFVVLIVFEFMTTPKKTIGNN